MLTGSKPEGVPSFVHPRALYLYLRECESRVFNHQIEPANVRYQPTKETILRTNTDRLWHDIEATARWGAIHDSTGTNRLSLSDSDKKVRDWFVSEARSIGYNVKIDAMGNIFAILPGLNMDLPPIGLGSHLDTQPALLSPGGHPPLQQRHI